MAIALTDATLVEISPPRVHRASILIEDGKVASVGAEIPRGTEQIDCNGKLVVPGFVCAHTHLYSSLARGMPSPMVPPENFSQILERVWWKLDRALDAEAIEVSAQVGALEAARVGTTTLIDHHASPSLIDGSLDLISSGVDQIGLNAVLCYEVSDRGGFREAQAGLRENERLLQRLKAAPHPRLRGMVGAHAAFTLSDATADALSDLSAAHQVGVHIHVAEDEVDALKNGYPTLSWLAQHGLLNERTLLAHAVHVSDVAAAAAVSTGAHVVHNPRSNANNHVGYARPSRFGERLLLGTDGIGADMRAEAAAAFFAAREHGDTLPVGATLDRNRRFAGSLFGSSHQQIAPGMTADLAVLDYPCPTPLEAGNVEGHLLFGFQAATVAHVLVAGKLILRDRRSTQVDEAALYARARGVASRLWARMTAL